MKEVAKTTECTCALFNKNSDDKEDHSCECMIWRKASDLYDKDKENL